MLNKKKLLGLTLTSLFTFAFSNAFAAVNGVYVGGQIGWGSTHQDSISRSDMNEILNSAFKNNNFSVNRFSSGGSDTGWAGRLFAGYQFDTNWAGELGWSKFSNMNTNAKASGVNGNTGLPYTAKASGSAKTSAVDLVAKGTLPLENHFSLYAKLGAAYLMQNASANASVFTGGSKLPGRGSDSTNKFYPTFGLGMGYDITPNSVIDLSWNRIQQVGNNDVSSTDLLSVGLNYHFG